MLAYIKTCDTIQVKLKQKPCHIKMAQLSDSTIFLRTYIGAVHNKITDYVGCIIVMQKKF